MVKYNENIQILRYFFTPKSILCLHNSSKTCGFQFLHEDFVAPLSTIERQVEDPAHAHFRSDIATKGNCKLLSVQIALRQLVEGTFRWVLPG